MTTQLSLSDIGARLSTDYNPRWLAYCRATGTDPDGTTWGFTFWAGDRCDEWAASLGFPKRMGIGYAQALASGHTADECTAWMQAWAEAKP